MAATADPVKLRKHRRIVGYSIFAFFFLGAVLANFGFQKAGTIAFLLIFPALLYVALLGSRIRQAENPMAKEGAKLQPFWKILAGNLLFAGFVLWMCSFNIMLANISAFIVIGVLLPMAASTGRESHELRRQRWARFSIYALAVSAGWVLDHRASENEQRNYNSIIVAVEQYKAAEKRYPDTLEQLVPAHLSAVPPGRWGRFMYYTGNPDDAHLTHMLMPPVKESYDFKSRTSRTWD